MPAEAVTRPGYGKHLAVLLSTLVGINVGYTAVLPFLPQISDRLSFGPAELTVFFVGFAVAKIVAQPLGGRATDAFGPRRLAAVALVVAAVGIFVVAGAEDGGVAIAGRLLWGLADGLVSPALYRTIAIISARYGRDPARGYAVLGTTAVLSFAAGPIAVGVVHRFADYRTVLTVTAVLTLVNAVVAWYVLPGRQDEDRSPEEDRGKNLPLDLRTVVLFGGIDFCANVLWSAIEPLVPLYLRTTSADPTGAAAWLLGLGMVAFAVASPVVGRLRPELRLPRMAVPGLFVVGVACWALSGLSVLAIGLPAMILFMVAQAYVYLVAREGVQKHCGGTGRAWGVFGMFSDAGFVVGPAVGVIVFELFRAGAFTVLGVAAIAVAALLPLALAAWRKHARVA